MKRKKDSTSSISKVPPQSPEAEMTVLAEMLLGNKCIPEVQKKILSDDFFYRTSHQKIFLAIIDVFKKTGSVDIVTLAEELKQRDQMEEVGGGAYLSQLLDYIAGSPVAHHANIVKEKALLRKILFESNEIASMIHEDREPLDAVLAKWQRSLSDLLKQSAGEEASQKLIMPLEHLQNYFADCRETPFEALNHALDGFFGGQMIIIGARGGMGKTAFIHNLLRHTAIQENRPAMYFGAQISEKIIFARLLSSMCKVPYNIIKKSRVINDAQSKLLSAAHKKIEEARISGYMIRDKLNAVSIMAQIRSYQDEVRESIGLVTIENLDQIIWPEEKFRRDARYKKDETDTILSSLRSFGLEMKIPIIISCQINRDTEDREDKRPELSNLKGTGNIEQIADIVLFPFRPDYYKRDKQLVIGPEPAELIIAKGGPPITIPMKFFGEYLCWEEVATLK